MQKSGRWVVIAMAFVWMAFVYTSFYLVQQQRPLSVANLHALGSTFLDLLAAGAILLVSTGLGLWICRWLGISAFAWRSKSPACRTVIRQEQMSASLEQLILGCGTGLGVLSMLILGAGLLGWLARWIVALLLLVLALLSLPGLARALLTLFSSLPGMASFFSSLSRRAAFYLGGTFLLTLLMALTPPIDWDGLFYHLTVPRLYIEQGRILPVVDKLMDIPHQHFPGLMEMLYAAAMLLRRVGDSQGDVAAKLLHLAYMALLAGVVYLLAQRHIGAGAIGPSGRQDAGDPAVRPYGWPAVVAYAAIPMVSVLGGWAYTDLALCFYQMVALYALFNWFEGGSPRCNARPTCIAPAGPGAFSWLAFSALSCGLAMGLKYTSFVCPLALGLLVAWRLAYTRARWGIWWRSFSILGGVAALAASPWYLKNLAWTGNPVYPFAYSLFGGKGWDAWRAAWYARVGSGLGWDWGEWLRLPWTLTLGLRDVNFYDGRTGPLPLLALPFLAAWAVRHLWRCRARPSAAACLLAFSLLQYAFWSAGVVQSRSLFQSRLLLPALVALSPVLALLFEKLRALDTPLFSLRRLVSMSVTLVLAANLCYQFLYVVRIDPLAVLVGEETREAFLTRNLGAHYAAMELIDERVPQEGRVLFLWEPRSYYCHRDAQPDPILERWAWLLYRHSGDLEAIARTLQDEGYTHLLLHRAGLEFVRTRLDQRRDAEMQRDAEADFAAWDAFVAAYLQEEAEVGVGKLTVGPSGQQDAGDPTVGPTAYQLYRLVGPCEPIRSPFAPLRAGSFAPLRASAQGRRVRLGGRT